jgi:hypothetical protein
MRVITYHYCKAELRQFEAKFAPGKFCDLCHNECRAWVGSLSGWSGTKGYWAKVDNAVTFSFNAPGLMRSEEFLNESPY